MKRILYITTTLPSVTLTFVYREIEILLKAGYEIYTVSMGRPAREEISAEALWLYETTLYLDQISLPQKFLFYCKSLFLRPRQSFALLLRALREREVRGIRDRIRILYHLLEAGCLFSHFENTGLEHIHSHFLTGPTSLAFFLARYLGIPFSFTMHASLIYVDPLMLRTKLVECKKAVTVSRYNKAFLVSKYGTEFEKKIDIIHCGINLHHFRPNTGEKTAPPVILSVGQLVERKGLRYLVDACALLKKKGLDFRCYIVGNGPEMKFLTHQVKKHSIQNIVKFFGRQPQEEIRRLLRKASVFVLPSIVTNEGGREGIPVALMEAMAMELPMVSTKTVGIPELIENGKEGLLVEQRNARQIASALEYLLKNPHVRDEMGVRGREKVKQHFNIEHLPKLIQPIFN
jgi:glycosyltransferase involved in cell wall biosynthesis